jgi:hypothetical protein
MAKQKDSSSERPTQDSVKMVVDREKYLTLGNAKLPNHPSPPPPPPKIDNKKED